MLCKTVRTKSPWGSADPTFSEEATVTERNYTVAEIAVRWKVSLDFVRRLFEREAGVLVFGNSPTHGKRRYRTLRVPKAVLERVERSHSIVAR